MATANLHRLKYTEEGVKLSVSGAGALSGTAQLKVLIRTALERKQIQNIDKAAVERVLTGEVPEAVIAPTQEEFLLDESVSVTAASNKLTASAVFMPADGGKLLSSEDILEAISNAGVVHGIDDALVASLSKNPEKEFYKPIILAKATPPTKGDDAWIENHFDEKKRAAPKLLADGSVDLKELGLFNSHQKGEVLSTLHPETLGIPGTDVLGGSIPAQPGRTKKLSPGKNTMLSEDGLQLLAAENGRVDVANGRTAIIQSLDINDDVGVSTGNVEFFGDVNVRGNIQSQYNLTATGSIEISENVGSSIIKSGGSIVIRQGVNGGGNCEIYSGGDITAKFISNATISAGGTVRADSIMNSNVSSYSSVIATGRYGLIVGGSVQATSVISAKKVGSSAYTATTLDIGIAPDLRARFNVLKEAVNTGTTQLAQFEAMTERLTQLDEKGLLNEAQKAQLAKVLYTKQSLEIDLQEKNTELSSLQEMISNTVNGRIHIKDEVFPNTTIIIGSVVYKVSEPLQFVTFKRDSGRIVFIPYSYTENI